MVILMWTCRCISNLAYYSLDIQKIDRQTQLYLHRKDIEILSVIRMLQYVHNTATGILFSVEQGKENNAQSGFAYNQRSHSTSFAAKDCAFLVSAAQCTRELWNRHRIIRMRTLMRSKAAPRNAVSAGEKEKQRTNWLLIRQLSHSQLKTFNSFWSPTRDYASLPRDAKSAKSKEVQQEQ